MGFFNHYPLESEGLFVSRLCVQLVIILILPRILHFTILQHLLQPRVISEIVSGIILGPSCLGQVDGFTSLFFPPRSIPYLACLSQLGVIFFLFMTGLHLNVTIIWQYKWFAVIASFTAISFTFAIAPGLAIPFENPEYTAFNYTELIILMAILLSIPAEAVMARILAERGLLKSKLGSLCMATDTVGLVVCFILLAALLSIYGARVPYHPPPGGCPTKPDGVCIPANDAEDVMDPLYILIVFIVYVVALLTVMRWLATILAERTAHKGRMEGVIFVAAMVMCLSSAYVTQTLTLSSLLGSVLLGLLSFPRTGTLCQNIQTTLQPITVGIMLPVFFCQVGLNSNFWLLTNHDIMLSFLLLGALWCTTFVGAFIVIFCWTGRGFKTLNFAVLLTCKGLTALTIFNILFSVGTITRRFYSLVVLYSLISCVIVSPIVWACEKVRAWYRAKHPLPAATEMTNSDHYLEGTLVIPRAGYLSPVAATVGAWIANSMGESGLTIFGHLVQDIELIDEYVLLLQNPIPPAILTTDPIFGPAQVRWNGIRPVGDVTYKLVVSTSVVTGFQKLNKSPKGNPVHFSTIIVGYDHTDESKRIISTALIQASATVIVVTGQPAIALSGAHSALVVLSADRDSHTVRDLFKLQDSGVSLAYWRPSGNPLPELQDTETIRDVLTRVAKLTKPSFDAIFCPMPGSAHELFEQLNLAYNCHIPVIFEGNTGQIKYVPSSPQLLPHQVDIRLDAEEEENSADSSSPEVTDLGLDPPIVIKHE